MLFSVGSEISKKAFTVNVDADVQMYTAILRYTTFLYKDRVYYIYTQDTQAKLTKARTPLEFVNIINHLCFFFFIKKNEEILFTNLCIYNDLYFDRHVRVCF